MGTRARFGEARLVREDAGLAHRLLFRAMGIADPAHYLHFRYVERFLDARAGAAPRRILDAGCGAGDFSFYLARRFPSAAVVGVDVDAEQIAKNRRVAPRLGLTNVEFREADLTRGGFGEGYDLALSIDVLEHVVPQDRAFRNPADSLGAGGWAYLHIPTARPRPVPFSKRLEAFHDWAEEEHIAEDLSAEQFAEAVSKNGFRVVEADATFGYWSGELATSLFALPFRDTALNRLLQAALAPPCRLLAWADPLELDGTRYAVGLTVQRASAASPS